LDFSQTLDFSLAAWANGAPSQVDGAAILAKGTGGGGEQYALDVYQGNYRFYGWVGDGSYYLVTAPVGPNNTWQHLAMVFSKSLNRLRFYLNGAEVASSTLPNSIIPTDHEISIGSRQGGAAEYNLDFNGRIDDVRLYSRALTPQDVAELYNQASVIPPSFVQQPRGGDYYPCETVTLSIAVDGSEPLNYQWKKDGQDISGATRASLVLTNVTQADAGAYQVEVSNSRGKVASDTVQVGIKAGNGGRVYHDVNATGNRDDFTGTVGCELSVGPNALTVTALGYEDQARDGLFLDHQVGIWDSSGTMVASVIVPAGDGGTLEGAWRYVALPAPVVLAANATYLVGAEVFAMDGDGWSDSGGSTAVPFGPTCHATVRMGSFAVGEFTAPVNNGGGGSPLRWAPANAQFTVVLPPRLQISQTAGTVTLSWGADFTGWILESAPALSGSSWTSVPGVAGNSHTVPSEGGQSYFRLRQP
jgi:hypothetical protein